MGKSLTQLLLGCAAPFGGEVGKGGGEVVVLGKAAGGSGFR